MTAVALAWAWAFARERYPWLPYPEFARAWVPPAAVLTAAEYRAYAVWTGYAAQGGRLGDAYATAA